MGVYVNEILMETLEEELSKIKESYYNIENVSIEELDKQFVLKIELDNYEEDLIIKLGVDFKVSGNYIVDLFKETINKRLNDFGTCENSNNLFHIRNLKKCFECNQTFCLDDLSQCAHCEESFCEEDKGPNNKYCYGCSGH